MKEIDKHDVALAASGSIPVVHLRVSSPLEASYRLILRTSPGAGQRGEVFAEGALGDDPRKNPDDHAVNFTANALPRVAELNGTTLIAVINFAAAGDPPTAQVDATAYLTQDGKYVPNGTAAYTGKFTHIEAVIFRFHLKTILGK